MASAPPEPPKSIVLGNFSGVKNTVSAERLQQGELETAINVDLDDVGQARRRRGYLRKQTGNFHSLREIAGLHLVVKNGMLGTIDFAYNFTPLLQVGPETVRYVAVGETVYFASDVVNGKIMGGNVLPWGSQNGSGQWVSPVMRPTDTLGLISGRMLHAPPMATALEVYKGRIYLAAGRVLWATELYLYDLVDKTKNFLTFEDDLTMIAAVTDGIYVGTRSQLMFLQGTFTKGMQMSVIMESGVIADSLVTVPYSKAVPQARSGPVPEGYGPMFMTNAGVCVALDGGTVYNLTQDHVVFPDAVRAAALYREDQGANAYVAVADSAGGPGSNARIGDYVDAEIVRASQGG